MFSASLGQGSRLPRWLCGVRPVSRPLWASVPELPRGLGSRWPLAVVRGCARCPRGCPGPATRPLHASSFSSLPWTSSSARDAADEKRASKAVAPLGGRLPGARAAHRDPSLHLPLGRGALPGAGPAPQRAPAPPAPPWAPLEKASVSGETDCAGWKLLSPRRTADFHVTDAVRSEGRGSWCPRPGGRLHPTRPVWGERRGRQRACPGGLGPSAPPATQGRRWGVGRLAHASCTELPCPGQPSFLDSRRPGTSQPVACVQPARRASFQGQAGAAARPPRRVSELGLALRSLGRFCSSTPGGWWLRLHLLSSHVPSTYCAPGVELENTSQV